MGLYCLRGHSYGLRTLRKNVQHAVHRQIMFNEQSGDPVWADEHVIVVAKGLDPEGMTFFNRQPDLILH